MSISSALLMATVLIPTLVISACGGGGAPSPTVAPTAAKPVATQPAAAQPTATQPMAAQPTATQPAAVPAATKPAAQPAASPAASQGNVAAGKAFFDQNCNGCHPSGSRGAGPALKERNLSADLIRTQVRKGGGGMPAFSSSQISDQQLNELVAYVQSLK